MKTKATSPFMTNSNIILTSTVQNFENGLEEFLQQTSQSVRAFTGPSGVGKTAALTHYLALSWQQDILPPYANIALSTSMTPSRLINCILKALDEKLKGGGLADYTSWVVQVLERNGIKLLIFDKADRLRKKDFQKLIEIQEKSHCLMIFIGLPGLGNKIEKYTTLDRTDFLEVPFSELGPDEIIEVVLPNLEISRWVFNPRDQDDRELGKYIYSHIRPSLRKLQDVLDMASSIAEEEQAERITRGIVDEALTFIRKNKDFNA